MVGTRVLFTLIVKLNVSSVQAGGDLSSHILTFT